MPSASQLARVARPVLARRQFRLVVAAAAAVVGAGIAASPAGAADGVWSSTTSGNWSDAGNWNGGNAADGAGSAADFNSVNLTADTTVTLDSARTLGNLTFGDVDPATAGSWIVGNGGNAANILTLDGGTPTITVNALGTGKSAQIDAQISATTLGFTKAGVGRLVLTNTANAGNIVVSAGTLTAGNSTDFSNFGLGTGQITIQGGATVNTTQSSTSSRTWTSSNAWVVPTGETGNLVTPNRMRMNGAVSGGGTLNWSVNTTSTRMDLQNNWADFTGNLNVTGSGTVRMGVQALSSGQPNFNAAGWAATSMDLGGSVVLQPQTNSGGNTIRIGSLSGSSATAALAGGNAGSPNWTIGEKNASTTYAGGIRGNSTLTKTGTGTLTLTHGTDLGYTGATNVNAGTLRVAGGGVIANSSAVNVANGATLAIAETAVVNSPIVLTSGSTLDVSGTTSPYTTGTGGIRGSGTVNGSLVHAAGTILPGTAGTAGTLSFANNFTLDAGSVNVNVSAPNVAGGSNDLISVAGDLTLGTPGTINVTVGASTSIGDSFPILQYAGTKTGSAAGWTVNSDTRHTFGLVDDVAGKQLEVSVVGVGTPLNLKWTGSTSTAWDVATTGTQNWVDGTATPQRFFQGDNVTFDDTAAQTTVALNSGVAVFPASIVVNSDANNYTISGAGTIGGTGSLTKSGSSTLTITSANSFSGGTTINGGTINIENAASALGTGTITMNAGTLAAGASGANLTLTNAVQVNNGTVNTFALDGAGRLFTLGGNLTGGGTLNITTPESSKGVDLGGDNSAFAGTVALAGPISMRLQTANSGSANATWDLGAGSTLAVIAGSTSQVFKLGALQGVAGSTLKGHNSSGGGAPHTFEIGGLNTSTTFAGNVVDGTQGTVIHPVSITKVGTGTTTLSGTLSYSGATTVNAGTLKLENSQTTTSAVTVTGGTLELASDGSKNRVINTPTVSIAGGKLDLKDNKLVTSNTPVGTAGAVVGNTRVYDGLQGMVQSAKAGDTWTGNGLTSSVAATEGGLTTIGIANGAQAKGGIGATETALWGGQTVTGSSILAMYTYAGDANLDGAITGDDYSAIDFGILFEGMDGYANGDFNYDGYVTGDDYSVIDLNILLQGPQIPTGGAVASASSAGLAGVTAVPEPSACGFALLGAAAALRRRRHT